MSDAIIIIGDVCGATKWAPHTLPDSALGRVMLTRNKLAVSVANVAIEKVAKAADYYDLWKSCRKAEHYDLDGKPDRKTLEEFYVDWIEQVRRGDIDPCGWEVKRSAG